MVDEDGNVLFHMIVADWLPVPVKVTPGRAHPDSSPESGDACELGR